MVGTDRVLFQMREWLLKAQTFLVTEFQKLRPCIEELDHHLVLWSFIGGHKLNLVDLCIWASIRSNSIALANIRKHTPNANRWYNFVEDSNPWLATTYQQLTEHDTQRKTALSSKGASYDIDLPVFEGPMTVRFPPEPSGYLHIGHAKAALLNDYFAHQNGQKGVLICRFDDTNPSKESMEFQDAIVKDLRLMEIFPDKTSFSSDYFQEMYDLAVKLIKDDKAFADDSALGQGDSERYNRLPSRRRNLSISDTLQKFEEMRSSSTEGVR